MNSAETSPSWAANHSVASVARVVAPIPCCSIAAYCVFRIESIGKHADSPLRKCGHTQSSLRISVMKAAVDPMPGRRLLLCLVFGTIVQSFA